MKYAIDRYTTGSEKEVCADDFDGQAYIPRKHNRFFCPECGLQVFWVSKGGNQPNKFKHPPRTENSPECDKRVDGRSDLYLYERVGLPLYLSHISGTNYQLSISFPAVGENILAYASRQNAKITISGGANNRIIPINTSNFVSNSSTLIPVDFLPPDNSRYKIVISPSGTYSKKWSDYAEGFTFTGAIFSYDENGGKKIHRDDSIIPGRQYYIVSRNFSCPYSEVRFQNVGTLKLRHVAYQVYTMTTEVSLKNEYRYSLIAEFFRSRFGVGFLETAPEIIPLWPPVVEQDVLIPTKDSRIYCAIASGNDSPTVYSYSGNQVNMVPVHSDAGDEKYIFIKASQIETVLSVDRKYVGREVVFRMKNLLTNEQQYEYALLSHGGEVISVEELTSTTFSQGGSITSNAKMEFYLGSSDHSYLHIPVRSRDTLLPTFQNLKEILIAADKSIIYSIIVQSPQLPKSDETRTLEYLQKQYHGMAVPVPRWVFHLIEMLQRTNQFASANMITTRIVNGKLPIDMVRTLDVLYRAMREA